VSPADVARVRAATRDRKTPWTVPEIEAALPKLLEMQPTWKASASHNAAAAQNAFTLAGWTTGEAQAANMWFQIELPQPVMLAELQFDSANTGRGGGPGAGRGAAGGPAGAPAGAPGAAAAPPAPPPAFANNGYPRGYKVQVSTNGTTWSAPVAQGSGSGPRTVISFAPVQTRFVRITLTDPAGAVPAWSITNLRLYGASQK